MRKCRANYYNKEASSNKALEDFVQILKSRRYALEHCNKGKQVDAMELLLEQIKEIDLSDQKRFGVTHKYCKRSLDSERIARIGEIDDNS